MRIFHNDTIPMVVILRLDRGIQLFFSGFPLKNCRNDSRWGGLNNDQFRMKGNYGDKI